MAVSPLSSNFISTSTPWDISPKIIALEYRPDCTWTLSALEALRNALYKFKTYLLTY